MWMLFLSFFIPYMTLSGFCFYLDTFRPQLRSLKSQESQAIKYIAYMPRVFLNLCILLPILNAIVYGSGMVAIETRNFSTLICVLHILLFAVVFDVMFFIVHSLLHKYWMNIHKVHHQMITSVGFGALYCSPVEFIIANFFPAVLGIVIAENVHINTLIIWNMMAATSIVLTHSGYNLIDKSKHVRHHTSSDNKPTFPYEQLFFNVKKIFVKKG